MLKEETFINGTIITIMFRWNDPLNFWNKLILSISKSFHEDEKQIFYKKIFNFTFGYATIDNESKLPN